MEYQVQAIMIVVVILHVQVAEIGGVQTHGAAGGRGRRAAASLQTLRQHEAPCEASYHHS